MAHIYECNKTIHHKLLESPNVHQRLKNYILNRMANPGWGTVTSSLLATPETSGRPSTSVQRFDFWDRVARASYNWSMVSKVTVIQL